MALLLEEKSLDSLHKSIEHKQSNIVISDAFVELAPVSILAGQNVDISFSVLFDQSIAYRNRSAVS